jgi:branched-chain amino acid transport system permease protein
MRTRVALIVAAACALALPLVVASDFWIGFCITVLLSTLTGVAWNVLGGYGGQVSFGHAAYFGAGAYTAALLGMKLGVNAWVAFALAGVAGGLVGLVTGYLSFRYGLRGSYFALVTLAFAEVLRILAGAVDWSGGGVGLYVPLHVGVANLQFASKVGYYYVALALGAGAILVGWLIQRSRLGAWLVAIRDNEDAAQALGVNAFACKLQAITISAFLTGLGGAFYADYYLYIDPGIAFGPGISVEILLAPIIGGLGTVWGPFVGALALQGAGELGRRLLSDAPGLSLVFYGILLVVMVKFRPDGLIGLFDRLVNPRKRHA